QNGPNGRQSVTGSFVLGSGNSFHFQVGTHDTTRPLVIDPVLFYSSVLGGSGNDVGRGIAVDGLGNAYVTGSATTPTGFPTLNPLQTSGSAFVSKFDSKGNLLYSTYLGGSGTDTAWAIAVDGAQNAYVVGSTKSSDFPTVNALQTSNHSSQYGNAFLSKLAPTGDALLYSSYLGGSGTSPNGDTAFGVAVDPAGDAVVA